MSRYGIWATTALIVLLQAFASADAAGPQFPGRSGHKAERAGDLVLSARSTAPNQGTRVSSVTAVIPITGTTNDGGSTPGDLVCAVANAGFVGVSGQSQVAQVCQSVPVGTTQTMVFDLNWTGPPYTAITVIIYDQTGDGRTVLAQQGPFAIPVSDTNTPLTGCTLTASPASLPAGGGRVVLTAACTSGAPDSFRWSGPNVAGYTTGVVSTTVNSTSTFSVVVSNSAGSVNLGPVTVQVGSPLTITPSTLPDGTVGVGYSQTLSASGGAGGYTFTASGNVPLGLSLSSSGLLSGTPTTAGPYAFTVTVRDSQGNTGSQPYTVTIRTPPFTIAPTTLPDANVGTAYRQTLTPTGGTAPFAFTISQGAPPTGITLSQAGVLSGTPTAQTTQPVQFTVLVTDARGAQASQVYTLRVGPPLNLRPVLVGGSQVGAPGTTIPTALQARIVDAQNNPVPNAAVTWTVVQGGGTLSNFSAASNANGIVTANYTMGPGAQDNIVRVTVAGSSASLDFTIRTTTQAIEQPGSQLTSVQGTVAINTPLVQLNNIQQRLDNLRLLQNPTVTQGLNVSYKGQTLPSLNMIALALAPTDKNGKPAQQTGGGASADTQGFGHWGIFVQGDVDLGTVNNTGNGSSTDVHTNGITVGADYRLQGNHVVGAAIGFIKANSDLPGDGGSQDTKGWSLSLFGEFVPTENAYIDVAANFGWNKYDGTRRATDAATGLSSDFSSSPRGTQFGLSLSAGYQFYRQALTLTPYGRIEYVDAKIDAFQENGGAGALQIDSQHYKSTILTLGGQAQYAMSMSWGVLVPYGRIELQHAAQTSAKQINAQLVLDPAVSATLSPTGTDKNFGNFALGATAVMPKGVSGFFNYLHQFGNSNFDDDRFTLGVRVEF